MKRHEEKYWLCPLEQIFLSHKDPKGFITYFIALRIRNDGIFLVLAYPSIAIVLIRNVKTG